jgi:hypothetical protein
LGSSPFARHYSGNRGFFPFLRLLRCFSSPACRQLPYVFRQRHTRITTCGFPHSEIAGSKVGQHLPRAYRSRPRPSSALGAKASTVCPSSLDREEHRSYLSLWSFQGPRRSPNRRLPRLWATATSTVFQNSAAYVLQTSRSTYLLDELRHRTENELPSTGGTPIEVIASISLERR